MATSGQPEDHPQRRPALRRHWLARRVMLGLAAGLLAAAAGSAAWVAHIARDTPDVRDLRQAAEARPSVIVDAQGQVLGRFAREQREPVTLEQVSPAVVQALIATEDHRFHTHRGVDWRRTASALLHTAGGDPQGGSTITQQLARNLFPEAIGRERSLERKLREIVTALRIERHFDKRQILEAYLNGAPFLYNVVGIEMAARTYFGLPASDLDTLQAATLVGMLKGTSYYNPVRHPERARQRRNVVLGQMVRHGVLDAAAQRQLAEAPLHLQFDRPADPADAAPHFVAQVRRQVLEWADRNDRDLRAEGLVIHTTLDPALQQAASEAVQRQAAALQAVADLEWSREPLPAFGSLESYAKRGAKAEPFAHFWATHGALLREFAQASPEVRRAVAAGQSPEAAVQALLADAQALAKLKARHARLEAGFVAIDPASGAVRAWVGSRDFAQDQFDHVAQAQRQPGSTFKPFVYGAALESGLPWTTTFLDTDVEIALPDGQVWRPTDMGGPSGLPMSLREGLAQSRNTITAQVAQQVGVQRVAALARAMGVDQSRLDAVPSLALGTSPVTLLEMAGAYATLARLGERRAPRLIDRITDRHGTTLADFAAPVQRAMSHDAAVELIDMLRAAVNEGTGRALRTRFGLRADIAGKTGTTQDNTDGWFIGMHPQLVAGAWVGFNDPRITMRSDHWGQGGHNALLLVGDFYRSVLQAGGLDAKARFPQPPPPPEPPEQLAVLEAPAWAVGRPLAPTRPPPWHDAPGASATVPNGGNGGNGGNGEGYPGP